MGESLWQSPYVNIFKGLASSIDVDGDVQQVTDKKIGKTIFRISGQTPSANYARVPRTGSPPLALVGKYVYLIFKTEVGRPFVIHFDLTTNDYPLRLSFSNIYRSVKKTTRGILIPIGEFPRWSVLVFHIPPIVERYSESNLRFVAIRSIQLCAQMDVLNVLTSENKYNTKTLPREVALARAKGQDWDALYDWVCFPPEPRSHEVSQNNVHDLDEPNIPDILQQPLTTSALSTEHSSQSKHTNGLIMTRQFSNKKAGKRAFLSGPTPKLTLARVVGYTGSVKWMEGDKTKFVIFAANDVVVLHDVSTGLQKFLCGANGTITALNACFPLPHSTPHRTPPPVFIGIAQEKPNLIRIFTLPKDIFIANPSLVPSGSSSRLVHVPGPVQSINFASGGSDGEVLLISAGHDSHGRTVVGVWRLWPTYARLCMHTSDIHIASMRVYAGGGVPVDSSNVFDCVRMVSCGRGNVRAWRLKEEAHENENGNGVNGNGNANGNGNGVHEKHSRFTLKGCAIDLGRYLETTFTDIGFEGSPHTSHFHTPLRAYVSATSGLVFQINLDELFVEAIYNLHSNTPVHAVASNEGFCITGGDEGLVRIWPLDFVDFLIEAKHDGPVRSLDISSDGLQLLVGTASTSIGTLDIPSRTYHTFLRSHVKTVLAITSIKSEPDKTEIATASEDKTVRIWTVHYPKVDQVYEFAFNADVPLCLAVHPRERLLACGFSSGTMRVLDIQSTSAIHEVRQHQGSILSASYSPDGTRLFTLSYDSALVVYDCTGKYLPIHVIPTQNRFPSPWQLSTPFDKNAEYIAYVGGDAKTVILLNATTLRPRNIFRTPTLRAIHIAPSYPTHEVTILCTTTDGNLLIYTEEGQLLQQSPFKKPATTSGPDTPDIIGEEKPKAGVECGWVISSSDGRFVVAGGEGALFMWDRAAPRQDEDNVPWQVFSAHMDTIFGATFSEKNSQLICVGDGGVIAVWSVDFSVQHTNPKTRSSPPKQALIRSPSKHVPDVHESKESLHTYELSPSSFQLIHAFGYSPSSTSTENIVWKPETGLLAYPSGSLVVLEDLRSNTKVFLQQPCSSLTPNPQSQPSTPSKASQFRSSHRPSSPVISRPSSPITSSKTKKRSQFTHADQLHTILLSPDGKLLLTVSSIATIWHLHHIPTHIVLQSKESSLVRAASFTHDGCFIITISSNGKNMAVWHVRDLQAHCVSSIALPHVVHSVVNVPSSRAHSKDGNPAFHTHEFVTLGEGLPFYWFLHPNFTLQCQTLQPNVNGAVWTTGAFLPPSLLLLGAADGRVGIWDTASHSHVSTSRLFDGEIRSMKVDQQGQYVIIAGESMRKYNITYKNNKPVFSSPLSGSPAVNQDEGTQVSSMAWDQWGTTGIAGASDGSLLNIRWWDKASRETPGAGSMTSSIWHHSAGQGIEDVCYAHNLMLVCDAEHIHIWRFNDAALPVHEMRIKSQGARCIAISAAQDDTPDSWRCAWGCTSGRVNFYDATTQQHALFIPPQPLYTSPGGARDGGGAITALCFVFAHLVLCGDDRGTLSLVEFGHGSPRAVQTINVHSGKRITSMDSGKQGTVVVGDESGGISVWTTLPTPPYLYHADYVDFSHFLSTPTHSHHITITTLARVLPPASSGPTTNGFLAHPTSVLVAVKRFNEVACCTYDYHAKRVTREFPMTILPDPNHMAAPLTDLAVLQTEDPNQEGGIMLHPVLGVGNELVSPTFASQPPSHFTLNGFAGPTKGIRISSYGRVVTGFSENQVLVWNHPSNKY